jgi:cytochrome c-type biogenesis protein
MMEVLLTAFEQVPAMSGAAFAAVALLGLLMGVAPSSLPLVSVVVGYVAGRDETPESLCRARGALFALGFVLGMTTVDAAIGALFGFLGAIVVQVLAGYLALINFVIALLLTGIALALLRVVRVPWPALHTTRREVRSIGGAYLLGIPFGFSTCPACTPMVLPILGAAAASGTAWVGAALLFTFGLARGVPMLLAGTATGSLKRLQAFGPWLARLERAGGGLLLLAAVYFGYQSAVYAGWVPPLRFLVAF